MCFEVVNQNITSSHHFHPASPTKQGAKSSYVRCMLMYFVQVARCNRAVSTSSQPEDTTKSVPFKCPTSAVP